MAAGKRVPKRAAAGAGGPAAARRASAAPKRPGGEDGAPAPVRRAPARPRTRATKPAAGDAPARPRTRRAAAPVDVDASGKSLVIVESPTKSKTLKKFLGRNFEVMASNGHIMDLPKSKLGVDIEHNFEPEYVPIRTKNQALAKLKSAARTADTIFLAPDPDREGEAIAWHLATALESARRPLRRLTFNEITERAVRQALEQPREIDMNLVNAQQARRVLDRLVGYKVSPFVWRKVRYGLSAGRVQSVALRLICEREAEIQAFVPEEYWTLEADFETPAAERFTARLVRVGEEELESGQLRGADAGARAGALADELAGAPARVAAVQTKPVQVHPRAPFITSTLQQTAYNRHGFQAQRTMKVAQQLYEGVNLREQGTVGLITYMRTDSPRLAGEAIGEIREWLGAELGGDYVPESPRQFKGRKGAQEAHEAIRPTSVARTPDSVRAHLSEEQFKLYDLIWKRAVASQTASAEYLATTIDVTSGRLGLRATGRVLKFPCFQKLYGLDEDDEAAESRLPEVVPETALRVAGESLAEDAPPVRPAQHFTQPPPRYTEASLVKKLEEENIGRPSTYATIVGTITGRDYVERDGRQLKPTDLGMLVNKLLVESFPDVFEVGFTARMEDELDGIEEGEQEWHDVVRDLWGPLSQDLERAAKDKSKLEEPTDIACENCGRMLVKKFGRRGAFLACPGWPECKYTRPVDEAEMPVPVEGRCPECGAGLVARQGPFGRFISCERRPECKFTKPFTIGMTCPQCGEGEIAERRSKRGKIFYGCTRYPACDFVAWDRPHPVTCPNCGNNYMVEKVTRRGQELRCVKCRTSIPMPAESAAS
jgi:DNA topoisomerase I